MKQVPDYRMKWIRIWPHAWFDSSMRVELTNTERAFWIDVIALAGKSRVPGLICSDSNGTVGYPLSILTSLLVSWMPDEVSRILEKLQKTDRVQITRGPLLSGEDGWIVRVTNWTKYQSEAQRVQKYRNTARSVRRNTPQPTTNRCTTGRIEVEGEVEGEKERDVSLTSFAAFWHHYPKKVAKPAALKAWRKVQRESVAILQGLERWKQSPQWAEPQFIPYPATFLNQRRWEDEIPVEGVRSKHETASAEVERELRVGKGPETSRHRMP